MGRHRNTPKQATVVWRACTKCTRLHLMHGEGLCVRIVSTLLSVHTHTGQQKPYTSKKSTTSKTQSVGWELDNVTSHPPNSRSYMYKEDIRTCTCTHLNMYVCMYSLPAFMGGSRKDSLLCHPQLVFVYTQLL